MRLDKYLADMGIGTRTDIRKMTRAGRVTVNGIIIKDAAYQLPQAPEAHRPGTISTNQSPCEVCVDGRPVYYETYVYYMLNKPAGVLSAAQDRHAYTVVDLIRDGEMAAGRLVRTDLFPAGRLDKDTEGLLLVTNDGQLAHRLLSPRHHVDKVYYALVSGIITQEDVQRFRHGIQYDTNLTALPAELTIQSVHERITGHEQFNVPAAAERITGETSFSEIMVTIHEGKFHQIRKMVAALGGGKEVLYLKRLAIGPLRLDPALAPGQYRRLTQEECSLVKS